jgi:hypothetical protein
MRADDRSQKVGEARVARAMAKDDIQNPHDALFVHTFSQPEHAEPLLRRVLPSEIVSLLDFPQLKPQNARFVDPEHRHSQSDVLFKVHMNGDEVWRGWCSRRKARRR